MPLKENERPVRMKLARQLWLLLVIPIAIAGLAPSVPAALLDPDRMASCLDASCMRPSTRRARGRITGRRR